MTRLMALIFTLSCSSSIAQVTISKKKHDFGDMDAYANRVVDIEIDNSSNKDVFILRIGTERQVRYLYSRQTIKANTKETLRLKVNPAETGKFRSDVLVYLSSSQDPYTIKLVGNVREKPVDASPDCPDFSGRTTMTQQMEFDFKIKVIDRETKVPIEKAEVTIVHSGRPAFNWKTNRHGMIEKRFPLGYYYFISSAEGYHETEFDAFVNRKNHTLLIELDPKAPPVIIADNEEPVPPIDEEPVDDPVDDEPESDFEEIEIVLTTPTFPEDPEPEEPKIDTEPEEPKVDPEPTPDPKVEEPKPPVEPGAFTSNQYVANNIVFVMDISSSMKQEGKLDLLKTSMLELLDMLRPVDRITLVSFASGAETILTPSLATESNKAHIENTIRDLSAEGNTNGSRGVRLGYKLAKEHYIDNGNNVIIMTTDGAFNQQDATFSSIVRNNSKKGITMSVLGVKTLDKDERSMSSLAALGKGRFVKISDYNSAMDALKKEIKEGSKKP